MTVTDTEGWYRSPDCMPTRHRPPELRGRMTYTEVLALTEEQALWLTAMHEAGHAALYALAGVRLRQVFIRTAAEAEELGVKAVGQTTFGFARLPQADALAVAAAGERAADRWLHENGLWTEERAWVIEQYAAGDRADALRHAKQRLTFGERPGHPHDYTTVQADADTRLDALWDGVQRIADALVRDRLVDGAAVPALLHPSPTSAAVPWWHGAAPPAAALTVFVVEGLLLPGHFVVAVDLGVYLASVVTTWAVTRRTLRRVAGQGRKR